MKLLSTGTVGIVFAGALVGCSDAVPPLVSDMADKDSGAPANDAAASTIVPCDTPTAGCPCSEAGARVDCGRVYRIEGSYVSCSEGFVTCQDDGGWSACIGDAIYDGGR